MKKFFSVGEYGERLDLVGAVYMMLGLFLCFVIGYAAFMLGREYEASYAMLPLVGFNANTLRDLAGRVKAWAQSDEPATAIHADDAFTCAAMLEESSEGLADLIRALDDGDTVRVELIVQRWRPVVADAYTVEPEPVPLVAGGYMHDESKHLHESDLEWRRFWTTAPGGTVND
jgi:hypothetical protein